MRFYFFILMLIAQNSFAYKKEVKIAVYNNPPHVFCDPHGGGIATGATIDFINTYFASKKELDVKWVVLPFPRVLADIENKKVEMGLLVAKTPDREKVMHYSSISLVTTQSRILVNKDSKIKEIKKFSDLKGMTLGHSIGTYIPPELKEQGVNFDSLSGIDSIARNLERVHLKKIDGMFIATGTAADYALRELDTKNEFRSVVVPNEMGLYFVFPKGIDHQTYELLNELLVKNQASYQNLLSKYTKGAK